jgi:hypothetical protein
MVPPTSWDRGRGGCSPIFIWPRRTRRIWILATVGMHLGIALLMGLGVFGAIMIAFTVAAFGVSAEPGRGLKGT